MENRCLSSLTKFVFLPLGGVLLRQKFGISCFLLLLDVAEDSTLVLVANRCALDFRTASIKITFDRECHLTTGGESKAPQREIF